MQDYCYSVKQLSGLTLSMFAIFVHWFVQYPMTGVLLWATRQWPNQMKLCVPVYDYGRCPYLCVILQSPRMRYVVEGRTVDVASLTTREICNLTFMFLEEEKNIFVLWRLEARLQRFTENWNLGVQWCVYSYIVCKMRIYKFVGLSNVIDWLIVFNNHMRWHAMHTGALLLLSLSGENTFLKMKLI